MDRARPKSAGAVPSRAMSGNFTPVSMSRPMTPSRGSRLASPNTTFWTASSPKSDTGVTSDMLDAKLTRKRAESDLQLLANRIALLRMEEEKAKSKVAETQSKADQLARIKKRNEEIVKERMQKTLERENRIRENQIKAQAEREDRIRKLSQSRQYTSESRRALVNEMLEEKRRLAAVMYQGRSYAEQEKYEKAEEVRRRRRAMQEERERQRQEQQRLTREQYLYKMEQEALRKRQAEDVILQLESEERELINRLRKTQELQEKAYAALQRNLRN